MLQILHPRRPSPWISRVVFFLIVSLSACDSSSSGNAEPDDPIVPSSDIVRIDIQSTATEIDALGATLNLSATGITGSGQNTGLTGVVWTASVPGIVEIFPTGSGDQEAIVRGVANGDVEISATAKGITETISLTVQQRVKQIILGNRSKDLELPGDLTQIQTFIADSRGNVIDNQSVTWTSSNPQVATVTNDGLVEAVSFGAVDIQAITGGFTDVMRIEVVGDRFFLSNETRLRYELDIPTVGSAPYPALVWVHGSGQLDRNSQKGATDPLVPEGMAVLRYDKRGVGESQGTFTGVGIFNSGTTINQLADDAVAAIRFLHRLADIDSTRIGIAGNSQGGWIGPLASSKLDDVAFQMYWSGPTVSVGLEGFYSGLADGTTTSLDQVYSQLASFSGPDGYDPEPVLSSMNVPSMWLFGDNDRSIPTRLDTTNINRYQSLGLPFSYVLFESAGHDLRDTRTGTFHDVWGVWLAWLRQEGIL